MEADGVVPLASPEATPTNMEHEIDVYYCICSPPSRATLMLMRTLGLKHNMKKINLMTGEQMNPEFLKLNPLHTVPVINDGGFILWDSHAIMKYLVDQYAKDDSLFPKHPKKAAIVNTRLFFEATYLFPRLLNYCEPVIMGHENPDPNKRAKFEEALDFLDGFLRNQPWVAGQYLTIADFSIVGTIATAEAVGFTISNYPNVFEWYQRTKSAMANFGYEQINQEGAEVFAKMFKSQLK